MYRTGSKFQGVHKFLWISWLLTIHKNKPWYHHCKSYKISTDPQKYNPTNSLCFGYPQNFIPSKLNALTVYVAMYVATL